MFCPTAWAALWRSLDHAAQVIEAFTAACEANGLILDDRIDSVMAHDQERPRRRHEEAAEASRRDHLTNGRAGIPRARVRRSEVMALFRLRFWAHASYEAGRRCACQDRSDDRR